MDSNTPAFRKSSYSGTEGANCVEVAGQPGSQLVRDSKLGAGSPVLSIPAVQWAAFVAELKL